MKQRLVIVLSGLVVGFMANDAQADAGVYLDIDSPSLHYVLPETSEPATAQASVAFGSVTAAARAEASLGLLQASATAPSGPGFSLAQAVIDDGISFSAGAAGTAYLDWSLKGSLSSYARGIAMQGELDLMVDGASLVYALNDASCDSFADLGSCNVGTAIDITGSLPFAIHEGTTRILAGLVVVAGEGGMADFGDGAHLSLRLPSGVSYASETGVFLSSARPVTAAVPEPETSALLLIGMAFLAARRCLALRSSQDLRQGRRVSQQGAAT